MEVSCTSSSIPRCLHIRIAPTERTPAVHQNGEDSSRASTPKLLPYKTNGCCVWSGGKCLGVVDSLDLAESLSYQSIIAFALTTAPPLFVFHFVHPRTVEPTTLHSLDLIPVNVKVPAAREPPHSTATTSLDTAEMLSSAGCGVRRWLRLRVLPGRGIPAMSPTSATSLARRSRRGPPPPPPLDGSQCSR